MAAEQYRDQVRLLLDVLPLVMAEEVFALKGGTAINCSSGIFRGCRSTST